MEKNVKMSLLSQIYGKLLTEKQYLFFNDYYNNDLTLSEIAENDGITRQAVRDILKKGEQKLLEYEQTLNIMEKTLQQEKIIKTIIADIENIEKINQNEKINDTLKNVKENLYKIMQ